MYDGSGINSAFPRAGKDVGKKWGGKKRLIYFLALHQLGREREEEIAELKDQWFRNLIRTKDTNNIRLGLLTCVQPKYGQLRIGVE